MSNESSRKPDAFKARMAEAQAAGRPELAHQSLGRALTDAEEALADALMSVYADGALDAAEVANALVQKGILRPSTGDTAWSADNLAAELQTLNANLDESYAENGFGA